MTENEVTPPQAKSFADWAIAGVVGIHTFTAVAAGLVVLRAASGGIGALTHPGGPRVKSALIELAFVLLALLVLVVQLLMIGSLRSGSRMAWRIEMTFGLLALLGLVVWWAVVGLPSGPLVLVEIIVFGLPIAAATALSLPAVRSHFKAPD